MIHDVRLETTAPLLVLIGAALLGSALGPCVSGAAEAEPEAAHTVSDSTLRASAVHLEEGAEARDRQIAEYEGGDKLWARVVPWRTVSSETRDATLRLDLNRYSGSVKGIYGFTLQLTEEEAQQLTDSLKELQAKVWKPLADGVEYGILYLNWGDLQLKRSGDVVSIRVHDTDMSEWISVELSTLTGLLREGLGALATLRKAPPSVTF